MSQFNIRIVGINTVFTLKQRVVMYNHNCSHFQPMFNKIKILMKKSKYLLQIM